MRPDSPLTSPRGRPGPPSPEPGQRPRRSMIAAAEPVIVDISNAEDLAKLAEFEERKDEDFAPPRWLAKRVLKRQWSFRNDADRLTTCLGLLYPKGLTPTRGEIAFHAEQACSIPGLDVSEETLPEIMRRAADAAEDLFRSGYTIPKEAILAGRASSFVAFRIEREQPETTDEP